MKIGDKPGTITVRAGNAKNYDEVTITISAPAAPAAGWPGRRASTRACSAPTTQPR